MLGPEASLGKLVSVRLMGAWRDLVLEVADRAGWPTMMHPATACSARSSGTTVVRLWTTSSRRPVGWPTSLETGAIPTESLTFRDPRPMLEQWVVTGVDAM